MEPNRESVPDTLSRFTNLIYNMLTIAMRKCLDPGLRFKRSPSQVIDHSQFQGKLASFQGNNYVGFDVDGFKLQGAFESLNSMVSLHAINLYNSNAEA